MEHKKSFSLKDQINVGFITTLATELMKDQLLCKKLRPNWPTYFLKRYQREQGFELELKARVRLLSELLANELSLTGLGFEQQVEVLLAVAPKLKGLGMMFLPDYLEIAGLDLPNVALKLMERVTCHFSAEFVIRRFLQQHPELTKSFLERWINSPNEHLRRLASEGTRPRLPWSFPLKASIADPRWMLPLLTQLKADPSLYVRKSVANHLNDISKDHPQLVIKVATDWLAAKAPVVEKKHTQWIVKKALRTLLKQGHAGALELIGLSPKGAVPLRLVEWKLSQQCIAIGETLEMQFVLTPKKSIHGSLEDLIDLRLEYAIEFQKKGVHHRSRKVFMLKQGQWKPENRSAQMVITKKHHFKDLTTRKHYPGLHRIELLLNGRALGACELELLPAKAVKKK